jgi:hypothetical protein
LKEKKPDYNKQHVIRQVAHVSNHVKNLVFVAIINLGFGRSVWMSRKGENECEYNKSMKEKVQNIGLNSNES